MTVERKDKEVNAYSRDFTTYAGNGRKNASQLTRFSHHFIPNIMLKEDFVILMVRVSLQVLPM